MFSFYITRLIFISVHKINTNLYNVFLCNQKSKKGHLSFTSVNSYKTSYTTPKSQRIPFFFFHKSPIADDLYEQINYKTNIKTIVSSRST